MNDHLSQLGFSESYFEVRNYKKAIIDTEDISPIILPGSFVQWITDNVDHNSQTIDGKNTFHGMGIVTSVTPSLSSLSTAI